MGNSTSIPRHRTTDVENTPIIHDLPRPFLPRPTLPKTSRPRPSTSIIPALTSESLTPASTTITSAAVSTTTTTDAPSDFVPVERFGEHESPVAENALTVASSVTSALTPIPSATSDISTTSIVPPSETSVSSGQAATVSSTLVTSTDTLSTTSASLDIPTVIPKENSNLGVSEPMSPSTVLPAGAIMGILFAVVTMCGIVSILLYKRRQARRVKPSFKKDSLQDDSPPPPLHTTVTIPDRQAENTSRWTCTSQAPSENQIIHQYAVPPVPVVASTINAYKKQTMQPLAREPLKTESMQKPVLKRSPPQPPPILTRDSLDTASIASLPKHASIMTDSSNESHVIPHRVESSATWNIHAAIRGISPTSTRQTLISPTSPFSLKSPSLSLFRIPIHLMTQAEKQQD